MIHFYTNNQTLHPDQFVILMFQSRFNKRAGSSSNRGVKERLDKLGNIHYYHSSYVPQLIQNSVIFCYVQYHQVRSIVDRIKVYTGVKDRGFSVYTLEEYTKWTGLVDYLPPQ